MRRQLIIRVRVFWFSVHELFDFSLETKEMVFIHGDIFDINIYILHNYFNHISMVQRVTYRRRLSYNTGSNKVRKVRTPGSRVVVQYVQKRAHGPRAPHDSCDCGKRINGIAQLRPHAYKKLSKRQKTVSRPYGGVLCAGCVKSRIVRAFLLEEIKTIKRAKRAARKWTNSLFKR